MHRAIKPILAIAIAAVLALPATASAAEPMPREWHFNQQPNKANRDSVWQQLTRLVGKPAAELRLTNWHGGETSIAANKGKVIVVDFWATWCGPCIRSIPHNNHMVEKYADNLAFIAICAPRGAETMAQVADQHKANYPTAVDTGSVNYSNYNAQWFPFYVVIDQQGIIRATGVMPNYIENVVDKLLEEGAAAAPKGKKTKANGKKAYNKENPAPAVSPALASHLEGSSQRRKQLEHLHNNTPPKLAAENWMNTEALDLQDLKGSVVVVDFWATWCGPCRRAVPHTNDLQAKYKDQGLVILGVCHSRGAEKMPETVEQLGINYPVFADVKGQTVNAYRADGFPDYYVIGRDGKVFAADVKNNSIEAVIKLALAESSPES